VRVKVPARQKNRPEREARRQRKTARKSVAAARGRARGGKIAVTAMDNPGMFRGNNSVAT